MIGRPGAPGLFGDDVRPALCDSWPVRCTCARSHASRAAASLGVDPGRSLTRRQRPRRGRSAAPDHERRPCLAPPREDFSELAIGSSLRPRRHAFLPARTTSNGSSQPRRRTRRQSSKVRMTTASWPTQGKASSSHAPLSSLPKSRTLRLRSLCRRRLALGISYDVVLDLNCVALTANVRSYLDGLRSG